MSRALRVAVVGGGIGGLSTAIALGRIGKVEATVFEQASQLGEVGAGVGIAPNGMRMFDRLHLKDAVEKVGARYGEGSLYYRQDGVPIGEMTTSDTSGEHHTLGLHRADLVGVLADALPSGVVRTGHRLVAIDERESSVRLEFENGAAAEFDAVVGADGIHSVVREFATEPSKPISSGSIAYRGLVHADRLANWPTGIAELWMGEGKHFLTYPVRSGELINYVGFVPSDESLKESWSAPGDQASLARDFAGWDPRIGQLIEVVDSTFWWGLYDREPLARWSHGRVTLLGDAAHPMLPHLGQGANQAVEDAVTMAVVLRGAEADDIPARLESYEGLRRERTSAVQRGARDNGRRYDSDYEDLAQRDREIQRSRDYRLWLYDYDAEAVALEANVAID